MADTKTTTDQTEEAAGTEEVNEQQTAGEAPASESPEDEAKEGESDEDKSDDEGDKKDDEEQGDPEWLRKQLTEVRREAAARRVAQREAEEALSKAKSPEEYETAVKDFTDKITALEQEITVRDIASEMKIPSELRPFLKGDSEEEIRASAELLKQHVVRTTPPVDEESLGGGLSGGTPPASMDPGQLARQWPRNMR